MPAHHGGGPVYIVQPQKYMVTQYNKKQQRNFNAQQAVVKIQAEFQISSTRILPNNGR